jgi:hypothetical protein
MSWKRLRPKFGHRAISNSIYVLNSFSLLAKVASNDKTIMSDELEMALEKAIVNYLKDNFQ